MIHEHLIQFTRRNWTIRVWFDPFTPGILISSQLKVTEFADNELYDAALDITKLDLAKIMMKLPGVNRVEVTASDGNGESLHE